MDREILIISRRPIFAVAQYVLFSSHTLILEKEKLIEKPPKSVINQNTMHHYWEVELFL